MEPEPVPGPTEDRQPLPGSFRILDVLSRWWGYIPAAIPLALTIAVVAALVVTSKLQNFGWSFFGFVFANYGVGIFVLGSFLTSVPALVFAMVIGLGIAISSATYLPKILSAWMDPFVDLLAGIPSIVYGIWGYFVAAPFFGAHVFRAAAVHLAWIPGFAPTATASLPIITTGDGLAMAIIILTLMILPITTVLMRDSLKAVPRDLWESGLALGATRWEVNRRVAIPYAKRGIWGAAFLGFGRAIGETVAVFMVIDQAEKIPTNVFDGTSTMASLIIGTFDSALELNPSAQVYLHWLAELALVLMAVTLLVNVGGRWLIRQTYTEVAGL